MKEITGYNTVVELKDYFMKVYILMGWICIKGRLKEQVIAWLCVWNSPSGGRASFL